MELEFDKEIDALIRREGAARTITIGEFASLHPDADEIAAFLENAVPTNARAAMMGHFAGCDSCRRTLSNAIVLNGETVFAAPEGIAAPVEPVVPWYRRLSLFPNLAYVMGGLILLFGGFIGLTVFNSYQNTASVSQMRRSEAPAAEAPTEDREMFQNANVASMPANASNSSAAAANTVSNSVATANVAMPTPAANSASNTAASKDQNFALDGVSAPPQQPALAQPAKNEPKPADKLNDVADNDRKAAATTAEKERKRDEQSLMARSAPAPASGPMKKTGPSRDDRRETRASESDVSKRKVGELPMGGRALDPNRKQVSGKTFEFRQGAWFDTTYRGQGTTSVRRHTPDYRKLDVGLRGIAESFFGTVITVWNGKAYRIY